MKKTAFPVLCALLAAIMLVFSGCDVIMKKISGEEEEATTKPFVTSLSALPDEASAVVDYYNRLLTLAQTGKAGLSRETLYEINDLKLVGRALEGTTDADGSQVGDPELDVLNAAAKELRGLISDAINVNNTAGAEFGEPWGEAAPAAIPASAVTDATCVMGEEETQQGDDAVVYTDYYHGSLTLADDVYPLQTAAADVFPFPDVGTIRAELGKLGDYIVFEDFDATVDGNRVTFTANRLTDQIENAECVSDVHVTAHAKGVGKLADRGELTVFFTLKCIGRYSFGWVDPAALTEENA